MRIFEDQWDLKDIILIDNLTVSFTFQPNNGFPMLPFYHNKKDTELIHLTHFMKKLTHKEDIRPVLNEFFWIEKLYNPIVRETIGEYVEIEIKELDDQEFENLLKLEDFRNDEGKRTFIHTMPKPHISRQENIEGNLSLTINEKRKNKN